MSRATLPARPPAARAPAVLEQRPALERELADLRLQVAERALAAYEGKPEGREKLAALNEAIRTIEFQIESNGLAHELAKGLDRDAAAEWRRQVEADPDQATEGISRKACCELCRETTGCVITGDACAHPILVGGVGPRHQGNQAVRDLYRAAAKHLKLPGSGWEEDEFEDGDEFEDEQDEEGIEA
jgi:hypothetical protein